MSFLPNLYIPISPHQKQMSVQDQININFFLNTGYTLSGSIIDNNNNGLSDVEISLWL